jgi:ADP-heptose:LPS heptosyltransferase
MLLGPLERDLLPRLRQLAPQALFPGCTETETISDVDLSLAIARRLRASLHNDTGTGHLVAAAGTPVLSLFGRTDPRIWSPVGDRVRVISARAYGGPEMERIPVSTVLESFIPLVSSGREPLASQRELSATG